MRNRRNKLAFILLALIAAISLCSEMVAQQRLPARKKTVLEMMAVLKPKPAASQGSIAQKPAKYQIADCGTNVAPLVCCSYTSGDSGSTCEMFKLLCGNQGGTASGGSEAATCAW